MRGKMKMAARMHLIGFFALAAVLLAFDARADENEIGSVNTEWKLLGPDSKIVITAFDDPDIPGVACHLSRARTGGVSGMVGIAEDTSDAAISCRQVGPITLPAKFPAKKEIFDEHRSIWFKYLHVVRFYDPKHNTLVYLSYTDKVVTGSPKNSISTVPVMPWPSATAP
jgi:CreA protein